MKQIVSVLFIASALLVSNAIAAQHDARIFWAHLSIKKKGDSQSIVTVPSLLVKIKNGYNVYQQPLINQTKDYIRYTYQVELSSSDKRPPSMNWQDQLGHTIASVEWNGIVKWHRSAKEGLCMVYSLSSTVSSLSLKIDCSEIS